MHHYRPAAAPDPDPLIGCVILNDLVFFVDGPHAITNGLLLRSDVHTLFDRGYRSVDPHLRLLVSPRLREECGNGEDFYRLAGDSIAVPSRRTDRPANEYLEWHSDTVFKAS